MARIIREQQGHEAVPPDQVVRAKHHNEDDGDDDESPHDTVPLLGGDRRRITQGYPDPGRGEPVKGRQGETRVMKREISNSLTQIWLRCVPQLTPI